VRSTTPTELQRVILANRAQAYVTYGVIHEALRDLDRALSSQFTKQDSPKAMTAKCHYRRAKLLCVFARYDEVRAEYKAFVNLAGGSTMDVMQLKEEIDRGAEAREGSDRWLKDQLMRAVDVRVIQVAAVPRHVN
jgi:hypothetical protein